MTLPQHTLSLKNEANSLIERFVTKCYKIFFKYEKQIAQLSTLFFSKKFWSFGTLYLYLSH